MTNSKGKNGDVKNGDTKNGDVLRYTQLSPRSSAVGMRADTGARRIVTMGWHPDIPDFRDIDLDTPDESSIGRQRNSTVKVADLLCAKKTASRRQGRLARKLFAYRGPGAPRILHCAGCCGTNGVYDAALRYGPY